MKFNGSSGVRLWNKTFSSGGVFGQDYSEAIAVDSSDNVYIAGYGTNLNGTTNRIGGL